MGYEVDRHCDGFIAGKCYPKDSTKLDEPITFSNENLCQDHCKDTADCDFYSWTLATNSCMIYTADYRQRCLTYGGTKVSK